MLQCYVALAKQWRGAAHTACSPRHKAAAKCSKGRRLDVSPFTGPACAAAAPADLAAFALTPEAQRSTSSKTPQHAVLPVLLAAHRLRRALHRRQTKNGSSFFIVHKVARRVPGQWNTP